MSRDKNKPIAKTDTTIIHKHPPKKEKNRKERRLESYLTLKIIFVEENNYSKRNNFNHILFIEYVQMSRAG